MVQKHRIFNIRKFAENNRKSIFALNLVHSNCNDLRKEQDEARVSLLGQCEA